MVTFPVWRTRRVEPDPALCFVLMPFGKRHLDRSFETVVVPVAAELGLSAERADHGPEEIMEGIWERLLRARLVVADVTGENPNVMYEIGIAHALGKPLLLLGVGGAGSTTFDLRRYRHLFYRTSPRGLETLRADLRRELSALLEQSPSGSHLLDEVEACAREWVQRNHDSFSLHPEVVNLVRAHVPPERLSDAAVAWCAATAAHYGSVDHMVFWGRLCASRPGSATELAMGTLPGKPRRPAIRTARMIEQLPVAVRERALERMVEHGVPAALVQAVREGRVTELLGAHGTELSLLAEEVTTLLQQLPNIRLAT